MKNLSETLNWRYGVKRYNRNEKINEEDLTNLKEVIRFAPSSFGLQPFRVIFIENEELRAKLSVASYNQPQVTDASCLIVFAIETRIDEQLINAYFDNIAITAPTFIIRIGLLMQNFITLKQCY